MVQKKWYWLWWLGALMVVLGGTLAFWEWEPTRLDEGSIDERLQAKKLSERRDALRPADVARKANKPAEPQTLRLGITKESDYADAVKWLNQGHIDQAEALLMRLHTEEPGRLEVLVELAMLKLLDRKEPAEALPYLRKAVIIDPSTTGLREEMVDTLIQLGKLDEGLAFFQNLMTSNPEIPGLHYVLGRLHFAKGSWQKALAHVNQLDGQSVDHYRALGLRGQIYLHLGNNMAAREDMQESITGLEQEIRKRLLQHREIVLLVEDLDQMMFKLTDTLFKLGEYDQASEVVAKLAERIPGDPRVIALQEQIYKIKRASSL